MAEAKPARGGGTQAEGMTATQIRPAPTTMSRGASGDIHRVHNTVYGTDVTRIGSGARRYYD
jgi:hypothetical protein